MKHYTTTLVPARELKHLTKTTCDVCGVDVEPDGTYEHLETKVSIDTGMVYPEGGSGTKLEYDLCAECFGKHVDQHLQALGAKPTIIEWEN